ncbi:hypothetical protein B1209_03125 [Raoultella planticola]|jgi:hypothetical protein|uniref:Uncharacterized protein n=1 Tax=Raoultella planticola TaxID=575 RepID=A0A485DAP6_RAOPL|nr:hypothetical protein B1209_03125 [Raoultella planticola]KFD09752.1 putative membrane protein [Raoultella planticola ATCC 33531]KAJ93360.1 hypothetical protein DF41_01425 [Raoultella planticola]MBE0092744.1 hypothetical protein [Raoultella planticola]QEU42994.1 hypothetical protein F3X94_17515 [Raoultella planticola]
MFKSLLSILFTEILFPVWVFASASLFLYLVPEYWFILTVISVILLIIVHPILFGRFDKYDK